MKSQFFELADALRTALKDQEILLCYLSAERSDFVRFNKALVRQAGSVEQRYLSIRLIRAQRQASAHIALAGARDDFERARGALLRLRDVLAQLPEDPWLLIAEKPNSSVSERRGYIAETPDVLERVASGARGSDFVGFYAAGTVYR